ncbi:hypothetical protein JB92DRAFT_3051678 [Gautieria morchelliformis]|nr:hypothetical protein JB92DRAFT_3051678 [Gautieria morchelliformis]
MSYHYHRSVWFIRKQTQELKGQPPFFMEYEHSNSYQNEQERNVHVWGSDRTPDDKFLVLVAGLCTFGTLSIRTFYQWLDLILVEPPASRRGIWAIAPMKNDPRDVALPTTAPTQAIVLTRTATDPIKPGHYGIFIYSRGAFHLIIPEVKDSLITSRKKTHSASAASDQKAKRLTQAEIHRNETTRKDVRLRDMGCRITGQPALVRHRGPNFEGLEVAHIYPLAAYPLVKQLKKEDPAVYELVNTPDKIDHPENAMLLRGDVHSYFDNYQIGVDNGVVYRFEKTGAPIGNFTELRQAPISPRPHGLSASGHTTIAKDVNATLLRFHFKTCLLWHVAKGGKEPQGRAIHTSDNVHKDFLHS